MDWGYYERDVIEIGPSGQRDKPIEIILPSMIYITTEQAHRIAKALEYAAQMAFLEVDSRGD